MIFEFLFGTIWLTRFLVFHHGGITMKANQFIMPTVITSCVLILSIFILTSFTYAQIPDPSTSYATSATTENVYIYCLPDGSGDALNNCRLIDGSYTDATITVTILDSNFNPVVNYPGEDLWVVYNYPAPYTICSGGISADSNTDSNGQTTFSGQFFSGGHGQGAMITMYAVPLTQPPFDNYHFYSPDINGDLIVDLTDIIFFAEDYFGEYNYKSDFYFDGIINLSDIIVLAQSMGMECS